MMNWTESDKRIFEYPSIDGSVPLFADPLIVRRKLLARSAGKIDELVDKYRLAHEASEAVAANPGALVDPGIFVEGDAAQEMLAASVMYAFDLQPFDASTGHGATEKYCLRLLDSFNEWREQKKTSTEMPPSSSPDSDGLPERYRLNTKRMSDFSGTAQDSISETLGTSG